MNENLNIKFKNVGLKHIREVIRDWRIIADISNPETKYNRLTERKKSENSNN